MSILQLSDDDDDDDDDNEASVDGKVQWSAISNSCCADWIEHFIADRTFRIHGHVSCYFALSFASQLHCFWD